MTNENGSTCKPEGIPELAAATWYAGWFTHHTIDRKNPDVFVNTVSSAVSEAIQTLIRDTRIHLAFAEMYLDEMNKKLGFIIQEGGDNAQVDFDQLRKQEDWSIANDAVIKDFSNLLFDAIISRRE